MTLNVCRYFRWSKKQENMTQPNLWITPAAGPPHPPCCKLPCVWPPPGPYISLSRRRGQGSTKGWRGQPLWWGDGGWSSSRLAAALWSPYWLSGWFEYHCFLWLGEILGAVFFFTELNWRIQMLMWLMVFSFWRGFNSMVDKYMLQHIILFWSCRSVIHVWLINKSMRNTNTPSSLIA